MSIDIFISAVSDEFGLYREFLRGQLTRPNVSVKVQEDFIPAGTETVDKLDVYIRECAAVIHLAGDMTGSSAKPESLHILRARYGDLSNRLVPIEASLDFGEPPLSYTQWEAYLAVYHGKPLVIAVPEPGTKRDTRYRVEAEQQASQHAHLERLHDLGRHVEIRFNDENQLGLQIFRSSILDLLASAGIPANAIAECMRTWDAARILYEQRDQLRLADRQRRMAMADLFKKVSHCLATVANEVEKGNTPDEICGKIYGYAQFLPDSAKAVLKDEQVKCLAASLTSAYNGKQLAGLQDPSNLFIKNNYVKKTKEASGFFESIADIMSAE